MAEISKLTPGTALTNCAEKYGCSAEKFALCQTQFVDDCPSAEESRKLWDIRNAKLKKERDAHRRYKNAMFRLKSAYRPIYLYHRFMRAIAWVLLLPFKEDKT